MPSPEIMIDDRFGAPVPGGLTRMPQKESLYSVDTYFHEGWEDLVAVAGARALHLAQAHALLLIRPDALASRKAEAILDWLPQQGFEIVSCDRLNITRHQAIALWRYQWNTAPRIRRESLIRLLAAGESLLLVVRSDDASDPSVVPAATKLARLKGSADPQSQHSGELRALLKNPAHLISFVHAADDPADFVRELAIFLSESRRKEVYATMRDGASMSRERILADVGDGYGRIPHRNFDLEDALDRLHASILDHLAEDDSDRSRLEIAIADARQRRMIDWRAIFRLLDARSVRYDEWDKVAVAGYFSDLSHEGIRPLIPGVGASG